MVFISAREAWEARWWIPGPICYQYNERMRNYDRVRSVYIKVERVHHPKNNNKGWVLWLTSVTLALGRLRQEDHYELDANFRYRLRPYLRNSDTHMLHIISNGHCSLISRYRMASLRLSQQRLKKCPMRALGGRGTGGQRTTPVFVSKV